MNQPVSPQEKLTVKKFIPGIAWFFLVLVLLCLPGKELPPVDDWLSRIYFDKWIHCGLFGVMSFLFMYPVLRSEIPAGSKWHWVIKTALAASCWGLTTEFIQRYFIPGRSFDLFDWSADTLGALLALLLAKYRFIK